MKDKQLFSIVLSVQWSFETTHIMSSLGYCPHNDILASINRSRQDFRFLIARNKIKDVLFCGIVVRVCFSNLLKRIKRMSVDSSSTTLVHTTKSGGFWYYEERCAMVGENSRCSSPSSSIIILPKPFFPTFCSKRVIPIRPLRVQGSVCISTDVTNRPIAF